MKTILYILKFGWPYIRKYRVRFCFGIFFGILFGIVNGGFVFAAKTLFDRLVPVAEYAANTSHAASSALLPGGYQSWMAQIKNWFLQTLDPWLPSYARPMDWKQGVGALLFLPLLVSLRGTVNYLSAYCMTWVTEHSVNDIRVRLLSKLTELSLDFFNRSSRGDLVIRISRDTQALSKCFQQGFADLITEPFTLISVFVALCLVDWKLAIISVFFLPLCIIPINILARKARRASRRSSDTSSQQAVLIVEMLSSMRIIQAFGLEHLQNQRFREQSRYLMQSNIRGTQSKELINPIIETISMIGLGIIILYVCLSHRSISNLASFLMGMIIFYAPIKKLASLHVIFKQTHVAVERLMELLHEKPTVVETAEPVHKHEFKEIIEFDKVSFSYDERTILNRLTFKIKKGQKIGIVGESGVGKSTIISLLFRFYDPTHGTVNIDGVDLQKVSLKDLRNLMALVSQDTALFDETVAQNIAAGRLNATRQEIENAAKQAGAHAFIQALPHGYETRIGEQGISLSGGQRQRLAIARAFVRNAPILVLDEATSSLDSKTEEEIQQALEDLSNDRTVISVAHRLSTLRSCDHIIVLNAGQIAEQGDFHYLLKKGGLFTEMAKKQGLV